MRSFVEIPAIEYADGAFVNRMHLNEGVQQTIGMEILRLHFPELLIRPCRFSRNVVPIVEERYEYAGITPRQGRRKFHFNAAQALLKELILRLVVCSISNSRRDLFSRQAFIVSENGHGEGEQGGPEPEYLLAHNVCRSISELFLPSGFVAGVPSADKMGVM